MADKRALSAKIPEDMYRQVDEYVDERNVKKSDFVRRAVASYLEEINRDPDSEIATDGARNDGDRPDGVLGSLLYDAEEMKHKALLMAAVLFVGASLVSIPIIGVAVDVLLGGVGVLYLLTAFFGFVEYFRRLGKLPGVAASADDDTVEA